MKIIIKYVNCLQRNHLKISIKSLADSIGLFYYDESKYYVSEVNDDKRELVRRGCKRLNPIDTKFNRNVLSGLGL